MLIGDNGDFSKWLGKTVYYRDGSGHDVSSGAIVGFDKDTFYHVPTKQNAPVAVDIKHSDGSNDWVSTTRVYDNKQEAVAVLLEKLYDSISLCSMQLNGLKQELVTLEDKRDKYLNILKEEAKSPVAKPEKAKQDDDLPISIQFIDYTGKYPNLCSGVLTMQIDGVLYTFGSDRDDEFSLPRFWCSGGSCGITPDNDDYCVQGEWKMSYYAEKDVYPSKIKKLLPKLLEIFNASVPWGCCGGCI